MTCQLTPSALAQPVDMPLTCESLRLQACLSLLTCPRVQGINIFLSGFVPTENLRFREEALTFKVAETGDETEVGAKKFSRFQYPAMSKTQVWPAGGGGVG